MTSYRSGIKDGTAISSSTPYKSNNPLEKKLSKRHKGIETAVKKLTKEDIDAVKKMNESYKTAFESALNEYGIKSPSELDESKRKEFFNHVDLEFKKGDN
jgi:ADP-heptose:LPS heptosyltransferase